MQSKFERRNQKPFPKGDVIFGGKFGMYQYFDMWQVIDEALKLARNLK